jgi:hypothetical protein
MLATLYLYHVQSLWHIVCTSEAVAAAAVVFVVDLYALSVSVDVCTCSSMLIALLSLFLSAAGDC